MSDYDPKNDFQSYNQDAKEELEKNKDKRWFKISLNFAAAQLVAQGASSEALSGARQFIRNLLQLSSERSTATEFPTIRLNTFDESEKELKPKK